MSETLRDLVVSLSLQTDNFTRNIKSVSRQIAEAESQFRLAAAGVEGFERTTTGLATQLSTLERRLSLQKDMVGQYQRALEAANNKLTECYNRQNDYAQRLETAKAAQQSLKEQVAAAAQQVRTYSSTLGESNSATIAARANLDALKGEYRASVQEVKKLSGQNTALRKATQNAADAVSQASTNLNMAQAGVRQTEAEINRCNQSLRLAQTNWDAAGRSIDASRAAIATFGREINLAESKFRLATAGIKDMDSSVAGLSAKLTFLREKLEIQEKSVEQYENALRGAREQLEAAQQANDPEKIRQASDAVIDAEAALNRARAAVRTTRAEIEDTNRQLATARSAWTAAGRTLETFGRSCDSVSRKLTTAGKALTTVLTTPILTLCTAAVKASLDFESSFAGVRKTVEATEAEFESLAASSKRMSTQIAASTSEINGVMATGGQLGIANEYLTDFTRVMIDLGNSCEDLSADEAATSIAKFANVMGTDQSLFQNIGSTIVDLGNNFATTEKPIMEMAQRLAGAGKQVGLTEAQVLGFAAALSSVGIEAQMGGSAFSKALIKMEVASATGGQALSDFGAVCGMTGAQFKALFESDPAAAFQAFIVGLSRMDEEGESAIAVLDEIGIKEVRLRDTLLRATNATELFGRAQATANRAWAENTALTTEANKRYATTESKLTNLKNKAMLFGQQIGDDLNPTIQNLIEGAGDLLDGFMELDAAQRMQIIRYAAIAAAAGPVLLLLGKMTKGMGVLSTGIDKFATSVGKAGGGFKGFMTVLGSSPAVWLALAAATITATYAISDYVTGAKQAREALKGMQETAEEWKRTAAETFYGQSGGLSFFGMDRSDFVRENQSAQEWLNGLIAVWTDGQKETDEIVSEWTDSFKALTESTRTELEQMRTDAQNAGYTTVADQLSADIETLDDLDSEIEALLKKRQNGYFSEADQIRLQELIDTREAIEVKYHLSPANADGFDEIRQKLDAEVARAQARGQSDADVTVYENAMVAAAEGLAAMNSEIDAQYDREYALIQLIEDSAERQAAMDALNAKYVEDRRNAAMEYAQLLSEMVAPVWEQEDIRKAASDVDLLNQKLREYSAASESEKPAILAEINALTAAMDEGAMTEYIAMLMQIQSLLDSGMTEAEVQALFPEIDFSTALEQIAAIQTFLNGRSAELPGLTAMFGEALPEEVLTIATDLDMTGAQARWNEFAQNPGAITTDAVITQYTEDQNTIMVQPQVDAFIAKYTEIPEGASTAELTPEGLIAYVSMYAEATNGADVSGLTPENVTAMVNAYDELASGTDISALKPDEITAYIADYLEAEGVDTTGLTPEGITAFVLAYEEVTGGALTTALTPDDITAMVVRYLEAEGVDMSALSPDQVEAIVSSFAEATGCDKSQLLQNFTAYIAQYDDTNAIKPRLSVSVGIYGYDLAAYRKFVAQNPIEVQGIVRLGEVYDDPAQALADTQARFWKDGVEIPASAVPEDMLTADKIAVLDEDGTLHVLITPEVTGNPEAIKSAVAPLAEKSVPVQAFGGFSTHDWGWLNDLIGSDVFERMDWLTLDLSSYAKNVKGTWADWRLIGSNVADYNNRINQEFDPETTAGLQTYVAEMVAAILSGQEVSEEDMAHLQSVIDFINAMDASGTGEAFISGMTDTLNASGFVTSAETLASDLQSTLDGAVQGVDFSASGAQVAAGIGEGMGSADMSASAEAMAANTESAANAAFGINSPARRMVPTGEYVAAGVGEGMQGYSFAPAAGAVAGNAISALSAALNSSTLRPVGVSAMQGLRNGILAGRSGVISAMRSAARAAVNAAKAELEIHSPSRVFENEVGVMTMRGLGKGVLKESKTQARIIRNAARYLTGEAREGSIVTTSNDNRRSYDNSVTSTIQVQQMVVRDEQDIRSLAVEIASLTRRQQRGKGMRMA